MSAGPTAATAIVAAVSKSSPIPPSSPFAELLRRSKFASYDPAIRQTYSSPSAHAYRGDWGLKRPIALRRRNAFISLASFESPAQFTEWNHAENQVRFIRRVEEMGVTPKTNAASRWHQGLGKAKTEWMMDSDFCPGETHVFKSPKPSQTPIDLAGLGNKGPGQYGANRPLQWVDHSQVDAHIIPNVDAMSRKQFRRYLRKLRELRPQFKEYLQNQETTANKSLYELAQGSATDHHTQFLLNNTSQAFQDRSSRQIEQQPHPNAGLMYACPSSLDTRLTTQHHPGIVLQSANNYFRRSPFTRYQDDYIVSFGGLSATVPAKQAGGKVPLFNRESEQGIDKSKLTDSVAYMRARELELQNPPRVVGRRAQGLKAVKVRASVAVKSPHYEFGVDNPHEPGTPEYVAVEARSTQSKPAYFSRRLSAMDLKQWNRSRSDVNPVLATLRKFVNDGKSKDRNDIGL